MKFNKRLLSTLLAIVMVATVFSVVPVSFAETISTTEEFNFTNLNSSSDVAGLFEGKAKVMHSDSTFTLNPDKSVTLVQGETSAAGIAFENRADSEIQEVSGSLYLKDYLYQAGVGFIHSKTVNSGGDTSYGASTYAIGADEVGGFYIAKDRGTVHINADGTPYIGPNNRGGTWGNVPELYIVKETVKTATTVKTYTQCAANDAYKTTVEYYTKDSSDVFTKHAKNTIGSDVFSADPTQYYTYATTTTNEFNLETPPEDCTDVKTVDGTVYKFTTIKTETGYFNKAGTKGKSISEIGVSEETINALKNVTSVSASERLANYRLRYLGENNKEPVVSLSFTVSGIKVTTNENRVPFYSSSLGKEKALGLAVINPSGRKNDWHLLNFGNFTTTYVVNKEARTLDLDSDVRYIGRHYVKDNAHTLGWEQSGFEFSFYGTGATITLSNIKSSTSSGSDRAYLNGYVDGVRQDYVTPAYEPTDDLFINGADPHTFVLAKDLEEGQHTIKVIKRSGSMYNSVTIDNIYIHQSENAQILEKPTAPERKIAVFGDSISEGMGILNGGGLPMNEDPTLSYASLAADAFGAEVSDAVAEGGIGVTKCSKTYTMGEVFDYVDYHNLGTEADNALYAFDSDPDAVVLNLGTNDGSYWNHTTNPIVPSEFVAGLKSLIKKIRAKYPEKPIFYVYGMMEIGDYAKSSIELALAELQAEGVTDIYFIPVSCTKANGEISYAAHPNALGHSRVSKHLIAKMAEVLGWETEDMAKTTVDAIADCEYTGETFTPAVTVKYEGTPLTIGTDYEVTYVNNREVGIATAKVTLKGDYEGYEYVNFNITCDHEGTVLTETTPADCGTPGLKTGVCPICSNPVAEEIPATGNHEWGDWDETTNPATYVGPGEATRSCTVCGEPDSKVLEQLTKIDLATEATITLSSTSVTYNGKEIKPTVTVKLGETPVADDFYNVQYANNKNAGTATVTVTAKEGNVPVSGVIAANFVIKPAAAKTFKLSATSVEYNGKVKTPSVTVKDANGITLKKDVDYTVKYASGRKNVGKYSVKVTLKGNYTGSKTLNFTINPPKRGLSKLTAGKKKLTASWKAQKSQTTGYQLLVSSSSKFKSYKKVTVKSYKTTKTTVSKLSSKKYYYVKMRTYKKVGKTTYYSGWSSVKKVKIK